MFWSENPPYLAWLAYMAAAYAVFIVSQRFTDSGSQIGLGRGNFGKEISLRQAVLGYLSHPTAFCFFCLLIGMWAWRVFIANWSWLDLLVATFVVVIWPIVEWVVHVMILHARPRKIFGYSYDPLFAQIHRAHHRDPYHPSFGIVPPASLVQYFLLIPGVLFLLLRWPRPITMGAMVATMAFRYELWHYLIHSAYKPKSKWFRRLRDEHWRHHFQHEGYWFGITTRGGDVLFRTNPDPKTIPRSPTARTLGHDRPIAESPPADHTAATFTRSSSEKISPGR